MKKIIVILVIMIVIAFGYSQYKISNHEKQLSQENKIRQSLKNEANFVIEAKEVLPDDIDEDSKAKLNEAEIELNAAQSDIEASEAADNFYKIIVDLEIDDGIFATIEESYNKAVIGRNK